MMRTRAAPPPPWWLPLLLGSAAHTATVERRRHVDNGAAAVKALLPLITPHAGRPACIVSYKSRSECTQYRRSALQQNAYALLLLKAETDVAAVTAHFPLLTPD